MRSTGNSGFVDDGQVFAAAFAVSADRFFVVLFSSFWPDATEGIGRKQHVSRRTRDAALYASE